MANITGRDFTAIVERRDAIVAFMRDALSRHADNVNAEIAAFDAERANNPTRWAQLVTIKSILSPGAKLDRNIAMARLLTDALRSGNALQSYDDAEQYRAACAYGSRSVGKNIVNALLAWNMLQNVNPDTLAATIAQLPRVDAKTPGMGLKTSAWALALYDAQNDVFTIDVHMCRGIAELAGIGDRDNVTNAVYPKLAQFMLDIVREEFPNVSPLCVQWSMWNEFRHSGQHASHIALAR